MGTEAMQSGKQGSELPAPAESAAAVGGARRVTGQRGRAEAEGLPSSVSRLLPRPEAPCGHLRGQSSPPSARVLPGWLLARGWGGTEHAQHARELPFGKRK